MRSEDLSGLSPIKLPLYDRSQLSQWRHVRWELNAADYASRGIKASETNSKNLRNGWMQISCGRTKVKLGPAAKNSCLPHSSLSGTPAHPQSQIATWSVLKVKEKLIVQSYVYTFDSNLRCYWVREEDCKGRTGAVVSCWDRSESDNKSTCST